MASPTITRFKNEQKKSQHKNVDKDFNHSSFTLLGLRKSKAGLLQQILDIYNISRNVWHGLKSEPFIYNLK